MVKYLLALVFVFATYLLHAQSWPNFINKQSVPCQFDSSVTILGYKGWEAYQTLDDTWAGPRDSSSCISFAPVNGNYKAVIKFNDIDTSKAVFVRALFNPILLEENALYNVNLNFFPSGNDVLTIADTCVEGLCSGFMIGVSVPDSAGTGTTYRWYPGNNNNGFCMPTEHFVNGNYLSEIIYRFEYKGTGANDSVTMYPPVINLYYDYINAYGPLQATLHAGQRYQYRFDERLDFNYWIGAYLLMYDVANGYPSHNNLYYMEVVPNPNPSTVDTIDVVMSAGLYNSMSYIFQPHTRMQGAHPDGDTINRHVVNIINEGADICLNVFFEKGFEKGAVYEHHSGEVNFNDNRACFLFGEGGKLVVADGSSFLYGNSGRGMMALKSGGTIEIGKGSELLVAGHITMFEYEWETQPNQIYMELNEGSKLTFLPGSRLSNMHSPFGNNIKLNIYMNGGLLDDSGLSPEDKRLINLIYPAPKRYLDDNVTILPNPVEDHLRISYNTRADGELLLSVMDVNGVTVFTATKQAFEGMNFLETEQLNLPAGTYILKLQSGDQVALKRFVLM